MQYWDDA